MIEIYSDSAKMEDIVRMAADDRITGFTTNPTLMAKSGITDYASFSHEALSYIAANCPKKNISLEVFADDFKEMERQALLIQSWARDTGANVYVKIPIMNTKGEPSYELIKRLSMKNVQMNVTAIFTVEQVRNVINNIHPGLNVIISIFAGRIADAGIDPCAVMKESMNLRGSLSRVKYLWASPREIYNYVQARDLGVDIITMTPDLIGKLKGLGKNLTEFSRETVEMFYNDAVASGYRI
jgi:transaldolase